jgi:uncharacterized protein (UPF0261 family)
VLLIDVGTDQPARLRADVSREEVAKAGDLDLAGLVARHDRGECVAAMGEAAASVSGRTARKPTSRPIPMSSKPST